MRFFIVFLLFPFLGSMPLAQQVDNNKIIKLSPEPKMRPMDRDWDFFKNIPCDSLSNMVSYSQAEDILLAKRKSQCTDKYKAFFNRPLER